MAGPGPHRWAAFPAILALLGLAPVAAGLVRAARPRAALPAGSPAVGRGEELVPLAPSPLPPAVRRIPPGLDLDAPAAPELVAVRAAERWESRRALIRVRGEIRAFAVGDFVPGGALVVAIDDARALLSRDDHVVELGVGASAVVAEDFPLAEARPHRTFAPDPALEAAVDDTLALLHVGEPRTTQVAVDALVEAGEIIVPYLVRRAGRMATLPGVRFRLPDGRGLAPRYEGAAVQAILEAITGQRFGDVFEPDASRAQIASAAAAWASWSGVATFE